MTDTKMTRHATLDDTLRDQAALFALDALPPEEARAVEAHLILCDTCRIEVESLRATVTAIGSTVPGERPAASLRDRVLDRAGRVADAAAPRSAAPLSADSPAQTWKGWSSNVTGAAEYLARAAEAVWEPTGFPGVETRRLFVDTANDRATLLIRMAPGATYPSHRHRGAEECLVLEGDLLSGDTPMQAGDYRRAAAGSIDGIQSTRAGCLLLIVSSLGDEILPRTTA